MKKLFLLAAVMLSSVGAFAQHAVGSFTLQPRLGINIATVTDLDRTKSRVDFAGGLLTSSLRHPKILIKEFSYFLMPCHQHGLRINLLV